MNMLIAEMAELIDTQAPTITIAKESYGEANIKINATLSNVQDSDGTITLKYYIKLSSDSDNNYECKYQGPELSYNFTGLSKNSSYSIKVEAIDASGNTGVATTTAGTSCFLAGTKVLTETGMKNIEDIEIGEKVYSINTDKNQKELKTVTNIFKGKSDETYELTIGDEIIKTTPKHQFFIVDKGWVRAYDLVEGDKIAAKDNDSMIITKIEHKFHKEPVDVYNLTVEGNHTYLITQYEMLVHNYDTASIPPTPIAPIAP